jgi:hypothetical protein
MRLIFESLHIAVVAVVAKEVNDHSVLTATLCIILKKIQSAHIFPMMDERGAKRTAKQRQLLYAKIGRFL